MSGADDDAVADRVAEARSRITRRRPGPVAASGWWR